MTRSRTILLATALTAAVGLFLVLSPATQTRIGSGRGNDIIVSLRQYHADHGRFPDRLDQLVPKHRSSIPGPGFGQDWQYGTEHGDSFILSFEVTRFINTPMVHIYDHRVDGWLVDSQ